MIGHLTSTNLHKWIMASALLLLGTHVAAQDEFFLDSVDVFGIEDSKLSKMRIVPVHMMDNDTLFLAASIECDQSMSMNHRLLNNRWLLDDDKSYYEGSEALREFFSFILDKRWDQYREQRQREESSYLPLAEEEASQFADFSNYRVRLSDDKFRLSFRYRFQ